MSQAYTHPDFAWEKWTSLFPARRILKGQWISIPEPIVKWLLADGLIVSDQEAPPELTPQKYEDGGNVAGYSNSNADAVDWSVDDDDGGGVDGEKNGHNDHNESDDESDDDDDDAIPLEQVEGWSEFKELLEDVIASHNGSVFVKSAWSAPKDAVWISLEGSLKVLNAVGAMMLFKASDIIADELVHETTPKGLVIKPWYDMKPSAEFRLFVNNRALVGISQRHNTARYPFLVQERTLWEQKIVDLWDDTLDPDRVMTNYVMDIYVTPSGSARIVDMAPWRGEGVDPLQWTWSELEDRAGLDLAVEQEQMRSSLSPAVAGYVPSVVVASPRTRQLKHTENLPNLAVTAGLSALIMSGAGAGAENEPLLRVVESAAQIGPDSSARARLPWELTPGGGDVGELQEVLSKLSSQGSK